MNTPLSSSQPGSGVIPAPVPVSEIRASCRLPLLVLFISAAVWLVIASVFALIASVKFHSPSFLADSPWLTYGRVHPAYMNSFLYGFCVQAALGLTLWLFAWIGQTRIAQSWLVFAGAKLWNLGVTIGIIGILAGDSTGFEGLEIPGYAAIILFLAYLMIGVWAAVTFHFRNERRLVPSQWFLLAALFWFPWIYSTANLLLTTFPVRGISQAVIGWWYLANFQTVWLGLVGLAALFYFVPKFAGRPMHSHYLSLFTFWTLLLLGGWTGIPNSAPVPAWIPTLSTIATALMVVPLIAIALNVYATAGGVVPRQSTHRSLVFFMTGVTAFLIAGLMKILTALTGLTKFTWFIPGTAQLVLYGFFAFIVFGAVYYIVPEVIGLDLASPKMVRANFWLSLSGLILLVLPEIVGGLLQGLKMQNPNTPFTEIMKSSLHFLRVSTLGELLILAGNLVFVCNLGGLVVRLYRARATAAYSAVTAEIQPAKLTP